MDRPSDPLVGDLEPRLELTDQKMAPGDTYRRPEVARAVGGQPGILRVLPGSTLSSICWCRVDAVGEPPFRASRGGGDEETRTPDPLLAKEMLFQLSYVPRGSSSRLMWWAFLDSNQRPLPYQGSALTS